MPWVVIANLKGLPGDAASVAELANRPKSTAPDLANGTNIDTYHQKQHVGWWAFAAGNVTGEPAGMGGAAAMLEVLAPSQYAAVQRVHDRNTRTTWERSIISVTENTWSAWRAFAMTDKVMSVLGVIGTDATNKGNVDDYRRPEDLGIWTLWAPFNNGLPKDARGRCTLEIVRDANTSVVQRLTERESGRTWTRTYESGWKTWVESSNRGPLQPFWNALAKSKTQPVNVVVVGDSNSEGYGLVEDLAERWINKLQPALNRKAGNWPGAKYPFIPPKYQTTNPGLMPVESSGNVLQSGTYPWGFGWRTMTLRDATAQVKFTFIGTSASVMYTEGSGGGIMNIQVDSSPVVTVNTSNPTVNAARRWDTGLLGYATHTVTITWNTANEAGKLIYLEGLLTWNNDEDRGVRIIDGSYTGRQMNDLTPERLNYLGRAMVQMGNVELVVVNLATNDARWDTPEATYRANALALVDMLRIYSLHVPVVFVLPFVGADHTREELNFYGGILGNIASNTRGVHFVDLSLDMPKIPMDQSIPAAQGLYIDPLHMSAEGHTKFAGLMQHALMEG